MIKPGAVMHVGGWFTRERFLLGKTPEEMEQLLGLRPGRCSLGACVLAFNGCSPLIRFNRLPAANEFDFGGYTYWLGGKPAGDYQPPPINEQKVKANVIESWSLYGPERPVKVIANIPHANHETYTIGTGVPQWKLRSGVAVPAAVISCLGKDERYLPYRRP